MKIREYKPMDCEKMAQLFYDTVHIINAKDYTKEQLNAWATGQVDFEQWHQSFLKNYTLIAEDNGIIIGFGDITNEGYLDRLYVHKHYQGIGVATTLCDKLESYYMVRQITTHASITSKHFFQKRGYEVIKEQCVQRRGVILTNFIMEKSLVRTMENY